MAHYAEIDENGTIRNVIVGKDVGELGNDGLAYDWEQHYSQVSGKNYKLSLNNARHGKIINPETGEPTSEDAFRKNSASVGGTYNEELDAFIPPKPFNSWILNNSIYDWQPPTPYPTDGRNYQWVEDDLNWQLIESEV